MITRSHPNQPPALQGERALCYREPDLACGDRVPPIRSMPRRFIGVFGQRDDRLGLSRAWQRRRSAPAAAPDLQPPEAHGAARCLGRT